MSKDYAHLVWTPAMVRNFWDYQSRFPQVYFSFQHGPQIVELLGRHVAPGATVVDYGCGAGDLIAALLPAGYRVLAVDVSPDSVAAVERRFHGVEGFLGAAVLSQGGSGQPAADAAVVLEVVEHLYDDQLDALVTTLRTLVKPGGVVLFSTPNEEDLERAMILCPVTNTLFHRRQHVRAWSAASLSDALARRGFAVLEARALDLKTLIGRSGWRIRCRHLVRALKRRLRCALDAKRKPPHLIAVARQPA
jgi:2-polyprenyl-3-methyl-5-hydroxy-6-metoxy-1,4-benzoquinol methylase